jgi:hypothetical protein
MRIEREYLDNNGNGFWILRSCNNEDVFLLQGNFQKQIHLIFVNDTIKDSDSNMFANAYHHSDVKIHAAEIEEKWYIYAPEQKEEVNKYISSRRD